MHQNAFLAQLEDFVMKRAWQLQSYVLQEAIAHKLINHCFKLLATCAQQALTARSMETRIKMIASNVKKVNIAHRDQHNQMDLA